MMDLEPKPHRTAMESKSQWETVYSSQSADAVNRYQPHALQSSQPIQRIAAGQRSRVIDIGGGASTRVDDLIGQPLVDVGVLDISGTALDVARRRLADQSPQVHWIEGDITRVNLGKSADDIWHDRAVFHFLTDPADRAADVAQARRSVRPGVL